MTPTRRRSDGGFRACARAPTSSRPAIGDPASGTFHRDLKPANIKVTDEGVVKIFSRENADRTVTFKMGMNAPGNNDRQFALNVLHWLSGLLD
jgi:hypothetical protein